jgi:hypothetical protein
VGILAFKDSGSNLIMFKMIVSHQEKASAFRSAKHEGSVNSRQKIIDFEFTVFWQPSVRAKSQKISNKILNNAKKL